ncbi:MAG TPA: SCP2 sterol-binding domain-containing protein [Ktedonobacterales bacterium]
MATRDELAEALHDYIARGQADERVRRALKNWRCHIHIRATDVDAAFTMAIRDGAISPLEDGLSGTPDLIVSGMSEDLANIFWGDENPASNYMQGAIKVQGSQDDVMKLDAMALFIYLDK